MTEQEVHSSRSEATGERKVTKQDLGYYSVVLLLVLIEALGISNGVRIITQVVPEAQRVAATELVDPTPEEVAAAEQVILEFRQAVMAATREDNYEEVRELTAVDSDELAALESANAVIENEKAYTVEVGKVLDQMISQLEARLTMFSLLFPILGFYLLTEFKITAKRIGS